MSPKNCVVILSGGQDSVTCLALAKTQYEKVHAITFYYGQAHAVEVNSARDAAFLLKADSWETINLPEGILESTSPLVNNTENLDLYEGVEELPSEGIEQTFVPMRNDMFLTIAANRAVAEDAGYVITGVSEEDFGGYPDCRETFIKMKERAVNAALGLVAGSLGSIHIETPLIHKSKKDTVLLAKRLSETYGPAVMEALAHSHTCYSGEVPPCGKCHACLLRQRGFEQAGIPDPLLQRLGLA